MHPRLLIPFLLCAATSATAQPGGGNQDMREVVSHEQLASQLAREEPGAPLDGHATQPSHAPAADTRSEPAPQEKWKPIDLLDRSEFLSFNGLATLVPKGAVLHIPPAYRSRIQLAENARIVTWAEFFRHNRNWISTFDVSRKQAEADTPIDETTWESLSKMTNVVIATLAGGPITVLREKPAANPTPDPSATQTP